MPKKVLVIDDDEFFARLTTDILVSEHYDVRTANSGEEGLSLAGEEAPDLVVLDFMMPGGIDGMEVLRRIKADARLKNVAVVFCSSTKTGDLDIDGAMAAGAADYIIKPYAVTDFLKRVGAAAAGGVKRAS